MNMVGFTARITYASIFAYTTTIALIIPVLLVAILVDSSRSTKRIGPIAPEKLPDRIAIRQSRRTLLSVTIGSVLELYTFTGILFIPNNDSGPVSDNNYDFLLVTFVGITVLLYALVAPHFEFHIFNIRNDPATARWTLMVGWAVDAILIASAVVNQFLPGVPTLNRYAASAFVAVALILTGAMITLTVIVIRRRKSANPLKEDEEPKAMPSPGGSDRT